MSNKGSRPFLVTVLAVLFLVSGLLSILGGIAAFTGLAIFGQPAAGGVAGGTAIIMGIINLVVSLGFLHGWSIMWIIGIIVTGLQIIGGFLAIISGNFGVFLSLILDVLILFYLLKPNVRKFFLG